MSFRGISGGLAVAVAAAVFAATASATAADDVPDHPMKLTGRVDHGGKVVVRIAPGYFSGPGPKTAAIKTKWKFTHLEVRCGGEKRVARLPVEGGFGLNSDYYPPNGPFLSGTRGSGPDHSVDETRVRYRVSPKGTSKGWVRVSGTDVPLAGGGSAKCDSGRLHWEAKP